MKVLSLLQPWASLVVLGAKKLETRSWTTAYRGTLLIHASHGRAGGLMAQQPVFRKHIGNFNELPFGAIIGSVQLDKIVKVEEMGGDANDMEELTLEEKAFGDYAPGRYVWYLSHPLGFARPTAAKGSLRLWEFPVTALL